MPGASSKARFFKTSAAFRAWLAENHASENELWVGFFKKDSGKPSVTYSESVDQAICFGWIDGVRVSIDEASYRIRFTPRKPRSIWSTINIGKATELGRRGLMHPSGIKAFAARTEERSEIYAFERKRKQYLAPAYEKKLKANQEANKFFEAQRPSYRRVIVHWIMSAKQEETRLRRLGLLIASSEQGKWAPPYLSAQKPRKPAGET